MLEYEKITERIYCTKPEEVTDRPAIGIIVGANATLLVDGGNSKQHAEEIAAILPGVGAKSRGYQVITHSHWDHVFGCDWLPIPTIAQRLTAEELLKMRELAWDDDALEQRVRDGSEIEFCRAAICEEIKDRSTISIVQPEIVFDEILELELGEMNCRIEHVGGDHAPDCCVVYVPGEKTLFLGDCLYEDIYHGEWKWRTEALFPLLDRILSYDAEHFIQSHGQVHWTRRQMEEEIALLKTMGKLVLDAGGNEQRAIAEATAALNDDERNMIKAFAAGMNR